MENQIKAGDTCTITREVALGGKIAFQKGEWVKVEKVEPDAQRPEYKYVVTSTFLQKRLKLTDADLTPPAHRVTPLPQMETSGAAFPPPTRPPGADGVERSKAGGFRSSSAFLPVVLVVAIIIIVTAFVAVYFVTQGGEEVEVGWQLFKSGGVQLSLPDNYVGGGSDELDTLVDTMKSLSPQYEGAAELMASDPDAYPLWAYDPKFSSEGFTTLVAVVADDTISPEDTPEMYVLDARQDTSEIPEEILKMGKMEKVSVGKHEAVRWTMEMKTGGPTIKHLSYAIKDGKTMYVVTFTTGLKEFNEHLQDFEKSIESFRY